VKGAIGIFDSGLGGLGVARNVMDSLPNESIVYFADTAHVPYGERSADEVKGFALGICNFLIGLGCKAVVMACNMSSAIALEEARRIHPDVPILGVIEPGAAAAAACSNGCAIGVLATTGTVKSGAYPRAIVRARPGAEVVQVACPEFVPLVESGMAESDEARDAAAGYVAELGARCGTIVLGCTHYPFVRKAVELAAKGATIVDPAEETTRRLAQLLASLNLHSSSPNPRHAFFCSGQTEGLVTLGSQFLGRQIPEVLAAEWNEGRLVAIV
jgi:glutamate racemase